jgi:predicted DNA-binding antitoxin AbrB/MazE fold protein
MNKFADKVTLTEGKKHSVGIADVKEILKIALTMLAELNEEDLAELLSRYKNI